jgi:cytochrome c oxidase subunit 2
MRIRTWFATVAVAGMALLPEALAHVNAGKDPVTAYAPFRPSALPLPDRLPAAAGVTTFEVVARRFSFEPSHIEVTVGDRVRLLVASADGVHGVGIRRFKVNTLVPRGGAPVTVDFVADAVGTFPILCSEACGDGHSDMRGSLVVLAASR